MKKCLKIICIIICTIIVLGVVFYFTDYIIYNKTKKSILFFKDTGVLMDKKTEEHNWIIKEVVMSREDYYKTHDLLGTVPKWEELSIAQQFSLVKYNGNNYNTRNTTISEEMIGDKIGNVVLTGYDEYTKATYTHNAEFYMVKTFQEKCIIAIQYEGTNEYYVAINANYRPSTLGNFMEDLKLKEIVSFGTIYYDYWDTDSEGNKHCESIEFPNVNNDIFWQMLFDDITVENVHSDGVHHSTIMSISVDIPLLGYKNINVSVSEDGYLMTNILGTGKTFYIGKEKVENFVNYIIENYDGYKTVYVDENGNKLSLEESEEEAKEEKDTIMVYDNTTNETSQYIPSSSGQNSIEPYNPQN